MSHVSCIVSCGAQEQANGEKLAISEIICKVVRIA